MATVWKAPWRRVMVAGAMLVSLSAVFFAQAPRERTAGRVIPNDPFFKYQIGFLNPGGEVTMPMYSQRPSDRRFSAKAGVDLDITRAWSITTGSKAVVVALMDDGFCYWHEDIRENLWQNPRETGRDAGGFAKETNGVDDDHNGYIDDVFGWDFAFQTPDPGCHVFAGMDATRIGTYTHSTPAMGIIGAKGNNGIGVAGINWNVSMMLLRIGVQGTPRGAKDELRPTRAAQAIRYAVDNGARVINWSGFVDETRAEKLGPLQEAIRYAESKGVLLVVAAGNSRVDLDKDENCTFPQCFENGNILSVAEVDFGGALYEYKVGERVLGSNYGARRVHIAAVGDNFSTSVQGAYPVYRVSGGTSNAAPVVAGVAALVLSVRPELKATELKKLLMDTVSRQPSLEGKIASGGIVNAYSAVVAAGGR